MAYTDIDDPSAYFQTTLYSGTGSEQSITNTGNSDLQPDWVWLKVRSNGTYGHALFDSVRGVNKVIGSNTTNAEEDQSSDVSLSAFNSDGFTVGGYFNNVNQSGQTFVSWQWKAGTSFTNDASSTSVGTIDSAGSVSTAAGFSIISYTGTGSTGTVAHGLGVKPSFLIYKNRATTDSWNVQSDGLTSYDYYLRLNSTGSQNNNIDVGPTAPTSTVVTVGSHAQQNGDGNAMILYAFAEKKGYSKFSSYTGNGNADGTFVYTGFKPAWVMVKRTDSANDWCLYDNKRDTYNVVQDKLQPNQTSAESDDTSMDFVSNGFKFRETGGNFNASGGTYIYMAFAENPFVTSTGVPATAR